MPIEKSLGWYRFFLPARADKDFPIESPSSKQSRQTANEVERISDVCALKSSILGIGKN